MSNTIRLCVAAFVVLVSTSKAVATPPTPSATLSMPKELQGGTGPRLGPVRVEVEVIAHDKVESVRLSANLAPDANPLLEKFERTRLIDVPISLKPQQHVTQQLAIKMPRAGRYELEVRLQGKSRHGGFSDRLVRYIELDEIGNFRLLTLGQIEKARLDAEIELFAHQTKEYPKAPDIRVAFGKAGRVSENIAKQAKPWGFPKEQRLRARPAPVPEIIRPFVEVGGDKPLPSGDPITVRGRIIFADYDGVVRPLVNATVWVWDHAASATQLLTSTVTDADGEWIVTVTERDALKAARNLSHSFGLANGSLRTRRANSQQPYVWFSDVRQDCVDGMVVDFGAMTPLTSSGAVQAWTALDRAWAYTLTMGGKNPGFVDSIYPSGKTQFHKDSVRIVGSDNDAPDTITHEYGHVVMERAYRDANGTNPSPGGSHEFWVCNLNRSLAWSEGWATAFMLAIRPDGAYDWHEIKPAYSEPIENFSAADCQTGTTSEGRVAAALNDMLDVANDDNGGLLDRGRTGHVDGNAAVRAALATMIRDTLGTRVHNDVLEFWSSLRCQLDSQRQAASSDIMVYNYMPDVPVSDCIVSDVVASDPAQHDAMRSGIRRARSLFRNIDPAGTELLDRFDRNTPEIALLLASDATRLASALELMTYLAELGDSTAASADYQRIRDQPLIASRIRSSIETLVEWLESKGSAELKRDVREMRLAYLRLRDRTMAEIEQDYVPPTARQVSRESTVSRTSALNPMSINALASPVLQGVSSTGRSAKATVTSP